MRIEIILQSDTSIKLPKACNHLIQGFLYSLFEPIFRRFLHNQGYEYQKRRFRLFCFSRIFAKFKNNKEYFEFEPPLKFFVSSPKTELLQKLAEGILTREKLTLGNNSVFIEAIKVFPQPEFEQELIIKMLSPLTVYSTLTKADGEKKTYYYSPFEKEFSLLIKENLQKKYKIVFGDDTDFDFDISIVKVSPHDEKIIIYNPNKNNKGTVIRAWLGLYKLRGSNKALGLSYDTGLGSKNSQGFGMWEVLKDQENIVEKSND